MASAPMYGFNIKLAIHRSSDVWLPRYASMVAYVGVYKVAEVPTNCYKYSIPKFWNIREHFRLKC